VLAYVVWVGMRHTDTGELCISLHADVLLPLPTFNACLLRAATSRLILRFTLQRVARAASGAVHGAAKRAGFCLHGACFG
jgi:hypothetical protein